MRISSYEKKGPTFEIKIKYDHPLLSLSIGSLYVNIIGGGNGNLYSYDTRRLDFISESVFNLSYEDRVNFEKFLVAIKNLEKETISKTELFERSLSAQMIAQSEMDGIYAVYKIVEPEKSSELIVINSNFEELSAVSRLKQNTDTYGAL